MRIAVKFVGLLVPPCITLAVYQAEHAAVIAAWSGLLVVAAFAATEY